MRVFLVLLIATAGVHLALAKDVGWTRRAAKAKIVKKLKTDLKKLRKQSGAIKLVGGENGDHEGNVEILYNGKWGNVCDDEWDEQDADVVCRQLGYATAIRPTTNGHFGQARRRYWMDNVYCDGAENELARCRFDGWGVSDCEGTEAAGVVCEFDAADVVNAIEQPKRRIKDVHQRGLAVRLAGGRGPNEGRVEIKLGTSSWGTVCGNDWSLLEANVVCRQLGLGYASDALRTDFFVGEANFTSLSGVRCLGNETNIADCLHDEILDCQGSSTENIAGVICARDMPDLVLDHFELMRTAHLEDRQLYWLQCAMEENCVTSSAYRIQRESPDWHLETRRLLRFTARILNAGRADFRPAIPKHLWEWHMCHMHYHSMEIFATFDVIDRDGVRVAEGHKASFCLEDNQCMPGVLPRYKCANYGDQGISVNCSDIYKHNIDCQWVDITDLPPGDYTFKVAVNPEFKVGEMSFDNNAAVCHLLYTGTYASVHDCVMGRP